MIEKEYSKQEEFEIANHLRKFLGPEWLSHRNGPSGRLTYIEGKNAITLANEVFGFNGWTSEIKDTTVDFIEVNENNKVNIGISVTMRITLKDGTYHEDIGYGASENARSKAAAFEKAKKQAVTDATKRTLRNFGNAVGNSVYDKVYLNNIGKMANPQVKFSPQNLYRHDQFDVEKQKKNELKRKQIEQEQRHQHQLELQRQRQIPEIKDEPHNAPLSIPAATTNKKDKNSAAKASTETTAPAPAQVTPTSTSAASSSNQVDNDHYLQQPLMPEDSFSYEGDDEFFVRMLENDDFGEVMGFKVDEDEPEFPVLTTSHTASQSSSNSNAPESRYGLRREPPLSDLPTDQSNKRSRLFQS